MSTATTSASPRLNRLLRGEISAIETYQQALQSMTDEMDAMQLRELLQDHIEAVRKLREHILEHGSVPDDSSGMWGSWAQVVEGTAKLFGQNAAIHALKAGEEHGINEYERALDDDDLPPECQQLIREILLPMTQSHMVNLDAMLRTA